MKWGQALRPAPCLHPLLPGGFLLGIHLRQKFIEVLLVQDCLFFALGQRHGGANDKTEDGSHIGTVLLRFDPLPAFLGVFAVVLYQPASR